MDTPHNPHSIHLSRDDMQRVLAQQSREQVLDSLEIESRSLLELNPRFGIERLKHSFSRKQSDDTQTTS